MDMTFEPWEQMPPDAETELLKMRKSLRKRNGKLILTSVVLVIAILFSSVQFLIPALENQYWDPTACTWLENVPDMELTMSVYTELFGQGQILMPPEIRKTGFAAYSIDACFLEWESLNSLTDLSYRSAALDKGQWHAEANFWREQQKAIIYRNPDVMENKLVMEKKEKTKALLKELPDYIQIQAAITFSRDLSMRELQLFTSLVRNGCSPADTNFIWAVLRSGEEGLSCGIHLTEYRSDRYNPQFWNDTAYPQLFPERYNWLAEDMEQHVLSMLRFVDRQAKQGTGLIPEWADENIYETRLSFMNENGVKAYGCYVIATPKALLEMLEESKVAHIDLGKAWIGV